VKPLFKWVYDYLTFILIISNQITLARSKPIFYVGTKNYYLKRSQFQPDEMNLSDRVYLAQNNRITASLIFPIFLKI
jgi:hypothetical protein